MFTPSFLHSESWFYFYLISETVYNFLKRTPLSNEFIDAVFSKVGARHASSVLLSDLILGGESLGCYKDSLRLSGKSKLSSK